MDGFLPPNRFCRGTVDTEEEIELKSEKKMGQSIERSREVRETYIDERYIRDEIEEEEEETEMLSLRVKIGRRWKNEERTILE